MTNRPSTNAFQLLPPFVVHGELEPVTAAAVDRPSSVSGQLVPVIVNRSVQFNDYLLSAPCCSDDVAYQVPQDTFTGVA